LQIKRESMIDGVFGSLTLRENVQKILKNVRSSLGFAKVDRELYIDNAFADAS
jgi:hypothetical protein